MKRQFLLYTSLTLALLTFGCKTATKKEATGSQYPKNFEISPVSMAGPVVLQVKSAVGRVEQVHYFHKSVSRTFAGTDLQKSLQDSLEFISKAETLAVDPEGNIQQNVVVTRKDGTANLHHFAMPELNEKLETITSPRGIVLKSGSYPKTSIFFVPTVSVPDRPVAIGDTWTMKSGWVSIDDGIPFTLEMVSILKGVHQCSKNTCAEIEMSGDVSIASNAMASLDPKVQFKSEWKGRMLFDMNAGTVLWSRVYSDEQFSSENMRREVKSCLESVLQLPADEKIKGAERATCEDFNARPPAPPPAPAAAS